MRINNKNSKQAAVVVAGDIVVIEDNYLSDRLSANQRVCVRVCKCA